MANLPDSTTIPRMRPLRSTCPYCSLLLPTFNHFCPHHRPGLCLGKRNRKTSCKKLWIIGLGNRGTFTAIPCGHALFRSLSLVVKFCALQHSHLRHHPLRRLWYHSFA